MAKVNFDELKLDEDHNILREKETDKPKARKPDEEKVTAHIKVYLKPREKEQLKNIAGRNYSAFVRDVLIEHGYIKDD